MGEDVDRKRTKNTDHKVARVGMASYNGESQKKVDACRNHRISKTIY